MHSQSVGKKLSKVFKRRTISAGGILRRTVQTRTRMAGARSIGEAELPSEIGRREELVPSDSGTRSPEAAGTGTKADQENAGWSHLLRAVRQGRSDRIFG